MYRQGPYRTVKCVGGGGLLAEPGQEGVQQRDHHVRGDRGGGAGPRHLRHCRGGGRGNYATSTHSGSCNTPYLAVQWSFLRGEGRNQIICSFLRM